RIFILNENSSAIDQITNALATQKDIEAIHILSHGSPGSLKLGADVLNEKDIETFSNQIKQWGNSLIKNGDILLYGCDVAAGETGLKFVKHLSEIAGADVAASNNKTGNQALGGDWELEVKQGEIETQPLNVPNYSYTLAPTGVADNKALLVSAAPTATKIDVLANDIGSGRLNVQNIATAPTNGTAIINDWIYVGGAFTSIGGVARNRIARLNSDGTVDATFNPNANDIVLRIAIDSSGNPIVGGAFDNIGGSTRNYIAKLNPTTGVADATFNPNASNTVSAIAVDSSGNPYVGGLFTTIGGSTRNNIAKLNPTTGVADATFDPNANGIVLQIALDSSGNPIVGGTFFSIGGSPRNRIAKLNPTTGVADATFNPNADDFVTAIALDSSGNPYVGGNFTNIGGSPRNRIAKLNLTTGVADATFNPNANAQVKAIALDSSDNPYVGGDFNTIGGSTRNRIAKLNPTTGVADATFDPNASGDVRAIAVDSSGNPYVGGDFNTIGGSTRNNIAKLNPTTGVADATFSPNANAQVNEIAIDPGRELLYTPNANFNGVDTFTYTAKDSTGTSSPITVTVLVNDSPALDNTGTPTLNAQNQNDSASTGTLISTIITNLGGTKITDPNASASQGIGITALDTANGTWQYTTNGTTWTNAPAVSATNALLLASDANTKVRFVPNAGYNGTVTNAITFVAWDRITGTNGGVADYTTDQTNNTTSSVFSSATETANITVNPVPTITSVSAATPDNTYGIGTNIDITVNFSEIVNVTGTPQLSLSGVTPVASYLSGSGTNTLTFRYAVAAGDSSADLDYASTTALSLSGGTIKNAATTDAILTLPAPAAANSLGANKAIVIDGILPTVTSVTSTTADGSYGTSGNINLTVNFSEAVTLAGGNMSVALDTGCTVTIAPFTGTSAVGTYTPTAGQNSTDLNSTTITLATGATLTDAVANNATLTIPAGQSLANNKAIIVDTIVPTVALKSASPTTTNTPFLVTATFSESVTGFIASDINLTNSTISNFTGSGTTYTFTVTPTATGNVTVDIPAATATDTAGNNNTAATQLTRTADITAPTVALTSASPTTTNAPFLVTATFSENVTGFIASDINLTNSTISNFTGSGTTYTFTVTPTATGNVTVDIPAATATDTAGNNNTAATQLTRTANITTPDITPPTVALTSTSTPTVTGLFSV
ncbi:DUF4347 domain-containing protein, partial [Microcoleus sp. herbarium8]|uniref:DUF4347 domain-containing protein n=1 Tax=Microcoleus sp. herbarium8 TaxID=3055436 RepID=UPI002FD10090